MTDNTAVSYWRTVLEVARKDFRIELRSKQVLNTAAVFALLVVIIFAFSFARTFANIDVVASGALWVAFVFAGTFSVSQSVAVEEADAGLDSLLLVPVDRSAIYVGKVVSNTAFTGPSQSSRSGVSSFSSTSPSRRVRSRYCCSSSPSRPLASPRPAYSSRR